jgi:hypothetical protein
MPDSIKTKSKASGVDPRLLARLRRVGGFKSNDEALAAAAKEFIDLREPKGPHAGLMKLFGTVDYFPDHDIKQMRRRKTIEGID